MKPTPDKIIKETVCYKFSDSELVAIARNQSQKRLVRGFTEYEKEQCAQQYAARIESLNDEIEADADKLMSGFELRDVECGVFYNTPRPGIKRIVRLDTNATLLEVAMTLRGVLIPKVAEGRALCC